jgi:hypothetical protein
VSKQEKDATKKHRHDIGEVDHGARSVESPTQSIQGLLGVLVVCSIGLTVWALAQMVG